MILDSGATSHFMRVDENLPNLGSSMKIVALPNGSTIKASHKTELLFESITDKVQSADVLPALKNNLLSALENLQIKIILPPTRERGNCPQSRHLQSQIAR